MIQVSAGALSGWVLGLRKFYRIYFSFSKTFYLVSSYKITNGNARVIYTLLVY